MMKKIDSLKKIIEIFESKFFMNQEDSKLLLKAQASLKEHVLNHKCTFCENKIDITLFESDSEIHDWHSHGMCKQCTKNMLLEENKDLKWLN